MRRHTICLLKKTRNTHDLARCGLLTRKQETYIDLQIERPCEIAGSPFANEMEKVPEAVRLDRVLSKNYLARLSSQTENTLPRKNKHWHICYRYTSRASRISGWRRITVRPLSHPDRETGGRQSSGWTAACCYNRSLYPPESGGRCIVFSNRPLTFLKFWKKGSTGTMQIYRIFQCMRYYASLVH